MRNTRPCGVAGDTSGANSESGSSLNKLPLQFTTIVPGATGTDLPLRKWA
ncbi:hypothetical protein [Pontivivens insulae]|uniref:Uncharacterized protein n=1 Tax=Pontivivens insulae TaxID=1639689 RepID=A0A2R8A932_9RHOB|nr:hypothetical protein [Pontivivens insulae]RED18834.1 hypothetical protein DFR53_1036 [Pontivivens insulae]SPF28734.1 hypothetical protein POI8812_01037 [Pontivivens insulae]